jgi:hypothetical protein
VTVVLQADYARKTNLTTDEQLAPHRIYIDSYFWGLLYQTRLTKNQLNQPDYPQSGPEVQPPEDQMVILTLFFSPFHQANYYKYSKIQGNM